MKMVLSGDLIPAVVLDLGYGGYGVVRSLVEYGVPVIGFCNHRKLPEYRTKLCDRKIYFNGDADLREKLAEVASGLSHKPVLYLTADSYVKFAIENRQFIDEHFLIHLPSNDVLNLLLDKTAFSDYALRHDILIPRTHNLFNGEDLESITGTLEFPVILKPFVRTVAWRQAKLCKAYYLNNIDELKRIYGRVNAVESRLMVQEWIPGGDSNIHYCLVYFNGESDCLASFTGYKIRQWPVGTGTASSTAPLENKFVTESTIALLKQIGYSGFGSVEYKHHGLNGHHYLIEPTVGRVEQIGYVATANGVNLPLRSYNALTGSSLEEDPPPVVSMYFIDELADFASAMVHFRKRRLRLGNYLRSLVRKHTYRYYNKHDLRVFYGLIMRALSFNHRK